MYYFFVCFYILDYCFWSHTDRYAMMHTDDLGALLGTMSPDLLVDGKPVDQAVLEDWNEMFHYVPNSDSEWIDIIDKFLDYYEKNEGFDFPLARTILREDFVLAYVPTAKEKAKETCNQHNY